MADAWSGDCFDRPGDNHIVRRAGEYFGFEYSAAVPIVMVGTLLLLEYIITLAAPLWERWLFTGGDKSNLLLVQTLNERLLTTGDMRQFLEVSAGSDM